MTDTDDQRTEGPGTSYPAVHEEEPDPNRSPDNDVFIEWDLAITNQRNAELRQQNRVKEFFAKVKNIKSVWDEDAREWLTMLPYTMSGKAIHSGDGRFCRRAPCPTLN